MGSFAFYTILLWYFDVEMPETEWVGVPVEEEGIVDTEERARQAAEHIVNNIRSLLNITYDDEFMSAIPKDLAQKFIEEVNQLTNIPAMDELLKTLDDIASILAMR